MHPRFEAYRKTELGQQIESIARREQHFYGYELLSWQKMPAVIAVARQIAPLLEGLTAAQRDEAKQFCGAAVGEVMREHGYEIVNPRGSARASGVFTLGAVWAHAATYAAPAEFAKTMHIAEELMGEYPDTLTALAK
jgi:hypothetical protein